MGIFPTCWELESMDGRNAEDGAEGNNGDMYVRYVYGSLCMVHYASSFTFHRYGFSIRVPHSEMVLGFVENNHRATVSFLNCQSYRAFSSQWNPTDFSVKCTGE